MLNRFRAFGWHLLASSCVALLSASLVFGLWYPGELASASGVRDIFLLLLLVDVVLGPVITLIIFNPQKKELRRDLATVVVIQLAAMLYGLHAVYIARPVYVVFNIDRFDLVYANDISGENLAKATKPEFQSLPQLGPKVIAARKPDDIQARNELLFGSLSGGDDLPQLPQYYLPYSEQKTTVIAHIHALAELNEFNKNQSLGVNTLMKKYSGASANVGYLPLKGKLRDLTIVVNRHTGEVLETVGLRPWR